MVVLCLKLKLKSKLLRLSLQSVIFLNELPHLAIFLLELLSELFEFELELLLGHFLCYYRLTFLYLHHRIMICYRFEVLRLQIIAFLLLSVIWFWVDLLFWCTTV